MMEKEEIRIGQQSGIASEQAWNVIPKWKFDTWDLRHQGMYLEWTIHTSNENDGVCCLEIEVRRKKNKRKDSCGIVSFGSNKGE